MKWGGVSSVWSVEYDNCERAQICEYLWLFCRGLGFFVSLGKKINLGFYTPKMRSYPTLVQREFLLTGSKSLLVPTIHHDVMGWMDPFLTMIRVSDFSRMAFHSEQVPQLPSMSFTNDIKDKTNVRAPNVAKSKGLEWRCAFGCPWLRLALGVGDFIIGALAVLGLKNWDRAEVKAFDRFGVARERVNHNRISKTWNMFSWDSPFEVLVTA